jgi:hypothetical protein
MQLTPETIEAIKNLRRLLKSWKAIEQYLRFYGYTKKD